MNGVIGNQVAWAARRQDEQYRKSSYGRRSREYAMARTARFDERDGQVASEQVASEQVASIKEIMMTKQVTGNDLQELIQTLEQVNGRLARIEQLLQGGASVGLAGVDETFPAVKLLATVDDGKVYWKVQGGRYMKHGIAIWPEVLDTTPWAGADPLQSYDLAGYTAVCVENETGHKKIVALQAPVSAGSVNGSANGRPKIGKDAEAFAADHWLREAGEAGEAVEPFMFDTAMVKLTSVFPDADGVRWAREKIFGEWDSKSAVAYTAALLAYDERRKELNGSVSKEASHKEGVIAAELAFERSANAQ